MITRQAKKTLLLYYILLLLGCDKPTSSSINTWLSDSTKDSKQHYKKVVKGVALSFPKDHQAHNDFRHEWWYFTANLIDQNGQHLGLQWTQFRFATTSKQHSPIKKPFIENINAWKTNQIYMAHSAVTTKEQHYADEKWSRQHQSLAGIDGFPLRIFLHDWQWQAKAKDLFPAQLQVKSAQFSYQLDLTSSAPYQKQGEQGFSKKNATGEVASYYYSQPFIEVKGEVIIDGKPLQVTGQGWIDREWSSAFLHHSQQGWDWFALRLNAQRSLVLFQLRDAQKTKANYLYGRIMQSDGATSNIQANEISLIPSKQTKIQGSDYPTAWQLSIPTQKINLSIEALNPLAKMPLSVPYWEGPVIIQGTHQGTGYMELTGY